MRNNPLSLEREVKKVRYSSLISCESVFGGYLITEKDDRYGERISFIEMVDEKNFSDYIVKINIPN